MRLIDSHCHLNMPRFSVLFASKVSSEEEYNEKYSTEAVINRALEAGVKYQLTIGESLPTLEATTSIVDKYPSVFRTVGIHPDESKQILLQKSPMDIYNILKEHCLYPKTVGVGEIGLDYSKGRDDEFLQKQLFRLQLKIAEELSLPVSIHSRDAQTDTIEILKEYPKVKGVIHCFSGGKPFADAVLELGYYIAVGGIVTYKNAIELRNTIQTIPLDRLLLETDSPFLAPVPVRGKINEPAFVVHTAEKVADLLGIPFEEICDKTSDNFSKCFSIDA